jgi:hypothetical protein
MQTGTYSSEGSVYYIKSKQLDWFMDSGRGSYTSFMQELLFTFTQYRYNTFQHKIIEIPLLDLFSHRPIGVLGFDSRRGL